MRRVLIPISLVFLAFPATALAHGLFDHSTPTVTLGQPPPLTATSGGEGAKWEFVTSLFTGNPHTDLDFFTQRGEMFASVGTLAAGPNGGGQTIVQLTDGGEVKPEILSFHPSASCVSNPSAALGLQHDAEAAPKGQAILNTDVLAADRTDAQIVIDATDAEGRCHDQGVLGIESAPQGGLEIIDVTNPAAPVEIGLTSHVGESHTVNVDPRRPHIAYSVTSDSIGVDADGKRANETSGNCARRLRGRGHLHVHELPGGRHGRAEARRLPARGLPLPLPERGDRPGPHEQGHHLRLPRARGLSRRPPGMRERRRARAVRHEGRVRRPRHPADFSDDKPRGTPLPCQVRDSSSVGSFATGAKVTDCVNGTGDADLSVSGWLASGAPSLEGVRWLGSAFHMGRESTTGAAEPAFDSTQDIDFDHEAEFSASGRFLLATDERGGGVAPPGASCSAEVDNLTGNGGVHAYRADKLLDHKPASPDEAFTSYARNSKGEKAILRMPIRTGPQPSLCTAHVFHQIPGQNRIFMGWYSQGTHVIDFEEKADGTIDMKEVAWFIPTYANSWVSAIFKVDRNADGSFTYWGATGEFNIGEGRNAIDVYKVTLPPPPAPLGRLAGTGAGFAPPRCLSRPARASAAAGSAGCASARPAGRCCRRAGRPASRTRRTFRYCVKGNRKARVLVVFGKGKRGRARLIASTARRHRARGVGAGARSRRVSAWASSRAGAAGTRPVRLPHQARPGALRGRGQPRSGALPTGAARPSAQGRASLGCRASSTDPEETLHENHWSRLWPDGHDVDQGRAGADRLRPLLPHDRRDPRPEPAAARGRTRPRARRSTG